MEAKTSTDSKHIKFNHIFEQIDTNTRKVKIVCTLGPSCWEVENLVKMIDEGMNVARLNFSHGDHATHGGCIDRLREALKLRPDKHVAIMLDTKGPEIRTGTNEGGKSIKLTRGQTLEITTDYSFKGNSEKIACSYVSLPSSVAVGGTIYIADGSLTCVVTQILENGVKVEVKNDCEIGEKKNMNLPGCIVDLPTLTEKDEEDITEFVKKGIDMIAASFVRKAEDIDTIRDVLGARGAHVKIIAKIENQEGLNNYDEILAATDGIMVARGDLGMEIAPEKVFIAQKWMIEKANLAAKPVITATQMLESMIKAPRPTRAEASDVANAVLDGTDAVMLSGETANGQYPLNAVRVMARTCCEAERTFDYKRFFSDMKNFTPQPISTSEAIAASAVSTVLDLECDLILILTDTGNIARLVSKYRPPVPILACCVNNNIIKSLQVIRGVQGFKIPTFIGVDSILQNCIKEAKERGLCKSGNKVVCLHSANEETPDESNIMKIIDIL